ncbi:MAG: hypothetical protein AAGF89_05055 [Bacteroidota bacterium]
MNNSTGTEKEATSELPPAEKRPASFYMALIAIVISLVGTGVSIIEARILREQQDLMMEEKAASVWPYVTESNLVRQDSNSLTIEFSLRNDGVGPALIGNVELLLDEAPISVLALTDSIAVEYPGVSIIPTLSVNWERKVLAAGDTEVFLRLYCVGSQPGIFFGNEVLQRLARRYCYCSIYGDCWEANNGEPEQVDNCNNGFSLK